MKKIFGLLITLFLLNGCAESVALLGSSVGGASKGRILQSSANTAISLGVKQRTGKSPLEHAIAYAEEKILRKRALFIFSWKTNSELCSIVKKQMSLTKSKILNKRRNKPLKDLTSSLQPNIDRSSKIKYLD